MRRKIKNRIFSFRYAWKGLIHTWRSEPNFNLHLILASLALLAGFLLRISRIEMILVIVMITLGLAAELANTTIEELIDFVTQEHHRQAKIAKDVAAAMVLVVAIGSLLVAVLIFTPYLFNLTFSNIAIY